MNLYFLIYVFLSIVFFVFGFFVNRFWLRYRNEILNKKIDSKIKLAEKRAKNFLDESRKKADILITEAKKRIEQKEKELNNESRRLEEKDLYLDQRQEFFYKKEKELDILKKKNNEKEIDLLEREKEISFQLENISGLSKEDAYKTLIKQVENEHKNDLFSLIKKLNNNKFEKIELKAKELILLAMQKISRNLNNDLVSSVVKISSEDVKGKIIGKDGRNIKTFERETGVQLIIDDTPNIITISSFDPVRRKIAQIALESLVDEYIVHPIKIEEAVKFAKENVADVIRQKGLDAVAEVGIYDLPEELIDLIGTLYYRSSYGQNVLEHSLEVAKISSIIASELGLDVEVVKKAGLLHDIGKALDANVSGSHIEIGKMILQKYNVDKKIILAMQSHHNDFANETLESYIIDTADAISASRLGARNDTAGLYLQKLEGLERITKSFEEVSEAYALSAGREVRVFVKPEIVDDYKTFKLARQIACKIENELNYPGEVKIAIIRETKVVEYAR